MGMDAHQLEMRMTNDVTQAVKAHVSGTPLNHTMSHETTSKCRKLSLNLNDASESRTILRWPSIN